ncbi:MAG: MurR/RpiR family transcriptional regulator [Rhodanobacteraceae bacterium]
MTHDLKSKLKGRWETFTESEQRIASYLLQNLSGIPFETAASLGKRVGVSAMTVGRFLRKLGYAGVTEMKEELRGDTTWLKLYRNPVLSEGVDADAENLESEMRALSAAHALAHGKEWESIVHLVACADQVLVASFQLGRFLGLTFATLLQQIRPRVSFAPGTDGAYIDLLVDSTDKSCVVLIEQRRYSRHFRVLAEEVAARNVPLVIFTDTQCFWARHLTPHVLMLPVDDERPWHSFGGFSSLYSLLLNAVIRECGDAVYTRVEQITDLRQQLVGFDGPSLPSRPAPHPASVDRKTAPGARGKRKGRPKRLR